MSLQRAAMCGAMNYYNRVIMQRKLPLRLAVSARRFHYARLLAVRACTEHASPVLCISPLLQRNKRMIQQLRGPGPARRSRHFARPGDYIYPKGPE